jgi:hypothetical protein
MPVCDLSLDPRRRPTTRESSRPSSPKRRCWLQAKARTEPFPGPPYARSLQGRFRAPTSSGQPKQRRTEATYTQTHNRYFLLFTPILTPFKNANTRGRLAHGYREQTARRTHRSLHDFPERPGMHSAILVQFLAPCVITSDRRTLSSAFCILRADTMNAVAYPEASSLTHLPSGVHGPLVLSSPPSSASSGPPAS